jgi:hypothetical protein
MNTETNKNSSPETDNGEEGQRFVRITERLKEQVSSMEQAVAMAKVDALRLFRELDRCTERARRMADEFPSEDSSAWSRTVSKLMDELEKPGAIMENLAALGIVAGRRPPEIDLEWLFGDES